MIQRNAVHMLRPAVRDLERRLPPGTRVEMAHDLMFDEIQVAVNGVISTRLTEREVRDLLNFGGGQIWERVRAEALMTSASGTATTKAAEAQRLTAEERAMDLLRGHLDETQQRTLERDGWFEVIGNASRDTYRIEKKRGKNVIRYRGKSAYTAHDAAPYRFDVLAGMVPLPIGDVLLAQKLILEADEEKFLKTACCTHLTGIRNLVALHPGVVNQYFVDEADYWDNAAQAARVAAGAQYARDQNPLRQGRIRGLNEVEYQQVLANQVVERNLMNLNAQQVPLRQVDYYQQYQQIANQANQALVQNMNNALAQQQYPANYAAALRLLDEQQATVQLRQVAPTRQEPAISEVAQGTLAALCICGVLLLIVNGLS